MNVKWVHIKEMIWNSLYHFTWKDWSTLRHLQKYLPFLFRIQIFWLEFHQLWRMLIPLWFCCSIAAGAKRPGWVQCPCGKILYRHYWNQILWILLKNAPENTSPHANGFLMMNFHVIFNRNIWNKEWPPLNGLLPLLILTSS